MNHERHDAIPLEISSKLGYLATRHVVTTLARELTSTDFSTLFVEMELDDCGNSLDPALVEEWSELWGKSLYRRPVEALRIAVQFLKKERGWSDEPGVHDAIRSLHEASHLAQGSDVTNLPGAWKYWIEAIARSSA